MATKKKDPNDKPTVVLTEPYLIYTKFADYAFIPIEAVDERWRRLFPKNRADHKCIDNAMFKTSDERFCKISVMTIYHNVDGFFDEKFDEICVSLYKRSYASVKAIWKSRFSYLSDYWYVIKFLEK